MSKYLKFFENHSDYETYIASSDKILPNVSYCEDNQDVHYNPKPETRVIAKFNVTDTSNTTKILHETTAFTKVEIDGVAQPSVETGYTFNTIGEHTVKYTLLDNTTIGNYALEVCLNLTDVIIPNGVETIGISVLYGCTALTSVTIPNSVTTIESGSFQSCSGLTSVTIPDSVTTIGNGSFQSCSGLTSVIIPRNVTSIGSQAFQSCGNLQTITSLAMTAPSITSVTFKYVKMNGTLYVPIGSTGYNTWMSTSNYYLGKGNWTKVEQ